MQQQGMKRKDLAERLGVSPQYVTRFLNTPGNTTVHQVVRFAEAVGLHVNLSLQPQPLTSTAKPAAGNRSSLRASRERYAKARIDST